MTPSLHSRHGDLVIYQDVPIPPTAVPSPSQTIQRGSSDSADHTLVGGTVLHDGEQTYLRVEEGNTAELRHESRHTTATLSAGDYGVVRLVVATDAGVLPVED